jgi:hypothetical protein
MGFAVFQRPFPGLRELVRLGLPIDLVRLGYGSHSQQRCTLRSFSLIHSVSFQKLRQTVKPVSLSVSHAWLRGITLLSFLDGASRYYASDGPLDWCSSGFPL